MRLGKFELLFNRFWSVSPAIGASQTVRRSPYQITATCRSADVEAVNHIIRQQLINFSGGTPVVVHEPQSQGPLRQVTIRIWCAVSERAGLVRLVSRLGLEKGVRSVRWEREPATLVS